MSGFPQAVSADIRGLTVRDGFTPRPSPLSLGASAHPPSNGEAGLTHNVYEGRPLPLSTSSSTPFFVVGLTVPQFSLSSGSITQAVSSILERHLVTHLMMQLPEEPT